jgi:hypothetical protein
MAKVSDDWPSAMMQAVRRIELEVGRVMRRQSGEMEYLRAIRDRLDEIAKLLDRASHRLQKHDEWERDLKDPKR